MTNFPNPDINIAKGKGVDRPVLVCYLAGRIAGNCIDKCLAWRKQIIDHYRNYEWDEERQSFAVYPISFLDALNSKEADSIDEKGLTSAIPPNLIYDKDLLSVETADVVVAMMDDYMEEGLPSSPEAIRKQKEQAYYSFETAYEELYDKVMNRRPNWGTDSEVAWALYLKKPLILIAGNDRQKAMLEKHPFMRRASVIVGSVEELLEKKWLQVLYKSIAGCSGDY